MEIAKVPFFVIANEVKQSMTPEVMDRHVVPPRDDEWVYLHLLAPLGVDKLGYSVTKPTPR